MNTVNRFGRRNRVTGVIGAIGVAGLVVAIGAVLGAGFTVKADQTADDEAAGAGAGADAGLSASRLYYQVGHDIDIEVGGSGARTIALLKPDNTELARSVVSDGVESVNLLDAFENLFAIEDLVYLQLLVNDEPTGSALVLQPLIDKYRPVVQYTQTGGGRTPVLQGWSNVPSDERVMSGFRMYRESRATLHTTKGDIVLVMRPDEAPNTSWNFMHLVEGGFYTHIPFHRVVEKTRDGDPFVIQAGDPSGTGSGGCAYEIDLEPTNLPHDFGVISMARRGDDLNSAGSQFFICLSREGTSRLDRQYGSFGQTIDGIGVVEAIAQLPVDRNDRPLEMPFIVHAELIAAPPRRPGERPSWLGPAPKEVVPPSSGAVDQPAQVDR